MFFFCSVRLLSVSVSSVCQLIQRGVKSLFTSSNPWNIICFFVWFRKKKMSISLKIIILYSAICLYTPYNISTCGFLKSWSVKFKSDGLIFFFFWKALDKWNQTIYRQRIDIVTMLINLFLYISDRRKIIKERWKILFLSSLIYNLAVMFFKWRWNKSVRYFLLRRWI